MQENESPIPVTKAFIQDVVYRAMMLGIRIAAGESLLSTSEAVRRYGKAFRDLHRKRKLHPVGTGNKCWRVAEIEALLLGDMDKPVL